MRKKNVNFSLLHVDEHGWPLNGHLVWATSKWWQEKFEKIGFYREIKIEKEIHAKYDSYFNLNFPPARKSLYVFNKKYSEKRVNEVVDNIRNYQTNLIL